MSSATIRDADVATALEAKHTPRPWRLRELTNGSYAVYGKGEYDIIFPTKTGINADAHLMVASPDLLEACQWFMKMITDQVLVRDLSRDNEPDWAIKMLKFTQRLAEIQALISKATREVQDEHS